MDDPVTKSYESVGILSSNNSTILNSPNDKYPEFVVDDIYNTKIVKQVTMLNNNKLNQSYDIDKLDKSKDITNLVLDDRIQHIEKGAFSKLTNLSKFNLPRDCTYFDKEVVNNTTKLKTILTHNCNSDLLNQYHNIALISNIEDSSKNKKCTSYISTFFINTVFGLDLQQNLTKVSDEQRKKTYLNLESINGNIVMNNSEIYATGNYPANVLGLASSVLDRKNYPSEQTILREVNLPYCRIITDSALANNFSLSKINGSLITSIGTAGLKNCYNLKSLPLNNFDSVGESGLYNNTSLDEVVSTKLTMIGPYAFAGCSSISKIDLPSLKLMGNNSFDQCKSNSYLNIPNVQVLRIKDMSLSYINISNVEYIDQCVNIYGRKQLVPITVLDVTFPKLLDIKSDGFRNGNIYSKITANKCSSIQGGLSNQKELKELVLNDDNFDTIPSYSLANDSKLTSFKQLSNVTKIESYGLSGVTGLNLNIPNIEVLEDNAVANGPLYLESNKLTKLTYLGSGNFNTFTSINSQSWYEQIVLPTIQETGSYLDFRNEHIMFLNMHKPMSNDFKMSVNSNLSNLTLHGEKIEDNYVYSNDLDKAADMNVAILQSNLPQDLYLHHFNRVYYDNNGNYHLYNGQLKQLTINNINKLDWDFSRHWTKESKIDLRYIPSVSPSIFANCNMEIIMLNMVEIPHHLCFSCNNLSYINIYDCDSIGDYAFAKCSNLLQLNNAYVEGIKCTKIGNYTFNGCGTNFTKFENIDLVKYIGDYAFSSCNGLQGNADDSSELHLPELTYIGDGAISNNTFFTKIEFGDYDTTSKLNFDAKSFLYGWTNLKSIISPMKNGQPLSINPGEGGFYYLPSLVSFPFKIDTYIGKNGLYSMNCLNSFVVSGSTLEVDVEGVSNNKNLSTIIIENVNFTPGIVRKAGFDFCGFKKFPTCFSYLGTSAFAHNSISKVVTKDLYLGSECFDGFNGQNLITKFDVERILGCEVNGTKGFSFLTYFTIRSFDPIDDSSISNMVIDGESTGGIPPINFNVAATISNFTGFKLKFSGRHIIKTVGLPNFTGKINVPDELYLGAHHTGYKLMVPASSLEFTFNSTIVEDWYMVSAIQSCTYIPIKNGRNAQWWKTDVGKMFPDGTVYDFFNINPNQTWESVVTSTIAGYRFSSAIINNYTTIYPYYPKKNGIIQNTAKVCLATGDSECRCLDGWLDKSILSNVGLLYIRDYYEDNYNNRFKEVDMPNLKTLIYVNANIILYNGYHSSHPFMKNLEYYYGPYEIFEKLNEEKIVNENCIIQYSN